MDKTQHYETNLRTVIEECGYTFKEVAEETGISPSALFLYARGERAIPHDSRYKIAHVLGCSPLDIMSKKRPRQEAGQSVVAADALARREADRIDQQYGALLLPGHEFGGDELLTVDHNGIMVLYELYMSGHPHRVEALLPLYAMQTAAMCDAGGMLLLPAARLASLAQQLVCELATDREDFDVAQISGQRAFDYAQLARDPNLEVAALIKQGSLGFHRHDGRLARRAYDQAIALASDERVTPLLRGRAYAGAAEVYAMRGEKQDALRAMSLAYDQFPAQPEQDPAYPYLYASRYSLHVYGACQTQLFLSCPEEAQKALELLEREGNTDAAEEPITRLDLLYYQAEIQVQQADQEAVLATLTEAAQLALQLGSTLYFRKLAAIYQDVHAHWPHDKAVRLIGKIFL